MHFSRRCVSTPQYALILVTLLALAGGTPLFSGSPAAFAATTSAVVAAPGTNLVQNGGAESGGRSDTGWDAVTIPGWQIVSGLPSVIGYGTKSFIASSGERPPSSGQQLFVGGAGGPAVLSQRVALHAAGDSEIGGATFNLTAALGGRDRLSDDSSVEVTFENAQNKLLTSASLAPVTARDRSNTTELLDRSTEGSVPAGATSALVELRLTTLATDYNGPNGSTVGFNYAYADDISLSLSVPATAPPSLRPPTATIPHFDHVFLIYLENQDYKSVIGNVKEAPFVNSLLPKSSLLANLFAEEHPSDGNYLSFAGGTEYDAPADDPAEENSQYTIDAKNIGDLVDSAHESWKEYLQSADGPCDNTVHDYYWDDDLPMMYFKDVRDRPGYCSAHIVPLNQYSIDLKKASTTPSFAWIGANDCDDMEGCGIKAGDSFLRTVATEFFNSPAWKTQPSLFIITWDEDGQDSQHPAQRVPTIVIGSQYVKKGFVSTVRYTHYSLLRTTEAALGLGTLTKNDEYATPLNDIFEGGR
ncbi:MAG TPA: alkaline phosphatase family protein [Acidimicrobiales bacterium]